MPKQTRHRTAYNGVYFVELADGDQSFFIRYKKNGKSFEERAGRYSQGCNEEKASFLRKERLSGVNPLGKHYVSVAGQLDLAKKWTFSAIFEAYLRLRSDLKGLKNDIYRFRNYIKDDFGDLTPSEVVPFDIESFRKKLQNQNLKPATVRHILELLRRLANYAFKKKFCPGLSFKINMPPVENQITENLTKKQLEKLLKVLEEEIDKPVSNIVRLVLYTGLRRGEIFSLRWNDIDFYAKTITIRSNKKEKHVVIPMNEMAEKVLAVHAQSVAPSKFVFPGRGGKKRTECKRPLLRIKKNAELPNDFRLLQGLRHVYASMLASSGDIDMQTLQKLLNHKSPLMTLRYASFREDALKNSKVEIVQEHILNTQDVFEEKPTAYCDLRKDYDHEVLCKEDLPKVAEDKQIAEIVYQNGDDDHTFETNEENVYLEDVSKGIELEFKEQETVYSELDLEPKKMEVDMDEIVSAEELVENSEDKQIAEIVYQSEDDDYTFEADEENVYLEDVSKGIELEFKEQETVYSELDLEPKKMEVDMDEIVSEEELGLLDNEFQVDEIISQNKEFRNNMELTSEISEVASKNGDNNEHISQKTDGLNPYKDKSDMQNVSRNITYQNSERLNSLKDIKIDLEVTAEDKEYITNSANLKRSSISELKKELMSLSDLIKSSPTKLKSSAEIQNP